jgi:hypothetical protein
VNAASLRHVFRGSLGDRLDVRFGVYALEDRTVSVLSRPGLGEPPGDQDALDALARAAAEHALRA